MSVKSDEDVHAEWLNRSFLEKALSSSEEDESISVTSSEVSRATAPGDNYGSDMYRVRVHFTRRGQCEVRSLIVKAEPLKGEITKILNEGRLFQRESLLLSSIVPQLHKILQETMQLQLEPFGAKCFYSSLAKKRDIIVLEDLKEISYKMAERTVGLDMNHCLLVLRTLAKYHAASVILLQKDPDSLKLLNKSAYNEKVRDSLDPFFGMGMKSLAVELAKWPEFEEAFSIKLNKISEVATDHIFSCQTNNPEDFNALTHGDLWINNMMFRYSRSTNQVEDIRFVDFQLGFTGDVALDLQYFLHTSPSIDIFDKHHILVEEYHRTLRETFVALRHEDLHPSLEQLKKQLHNKGLYAVIVACCLYAMTLTERSDVPDLEKMMKNEENVRFSKKFREALKIMLPVFERRGWLTLQNFIK